MESEIVDRRVYTSEFKQLTGWGETWIRTLEKRGAIPRGRVDIGGRRKWWPLSEVRQIVAGSTPREQQAA